MPSLATTPSLSLTADFSLEDFRQFMIKAAQEYRASDIYIQTESRLGLRIEGQCLACSDRPLRASEVEQILVYTFQSETAPTQLRSGEILDYAWELRVDRSTRLRFRVNGTATWSPSGLGGCDLTFRILPRTTPSMEDVGLPLSILPYCTPKTGIVMVSGATGQGKSTTMAALLGHYLQHEGGRIVDVQSPIEFTFRDIAHDLPHLALSEVPHDLPDFASAVWASLRRSPDVISIGETRDMATVKALISASLTGHLVYTTIHAGNIVEIMRRIVALTSGDQSVTADLPIVLRLLVSQRLLPGTDGRRKVVREYLSLDDRVRLQLWNTTPDTWPRVINDILWEPPPGILTRPFVEDCRSLLEDNEITERTARHFLQSAGGLDRL
ncbi:MAG: ATPase, T2SS/T4P/T4SS family [Paracoccaceae bacterium]|nr:ATPase, T2SS/T4P/T4SS family [Paracoccaceae bacterium]